MRFIRITHLSHGSFLNNVHKKSNIEMMERKFMGNCSLDWIANRAKYWLGSYMRTMLTPRSANYNLYGHHILWLSKPRTTVYGLHYFNYLAAKLWNFLPDDRRACEDWYEFKRRILSLVNFNIWISQACISISTVNYVLFFSILYFINVSFDRHVNLIFLL